MVLSSIYKSMPTSNISSAPLNVVFAILPCKLPDNTYLRNCMDSDANFTPTGFSYNPQTLTKFHFIEDLNESQPLAIISQ